MTHNKSVKRAVSLNRRQRADRPIIHPPRRKPEYTTVVCNLEPETIAHVCHATSVSVCGLGNIRIWSDITARSLLK